MSEVEDKRRHERVPVTTSVSCDERDAVHAAELRDLSVGGAFVATAGTPPVGTGAGVRLDFVLPGGARVSAYGSVMWTRASGAPGGPPGYGVQFHALEGRAREHVQRFVETNSAKPPPVSDATGVTRYDVSFPAPNQLLVRVSGALKDFEGSALAAAVGEALQRLDRDGAYVLIDASSIAACGDETLEHFRAWFTMLRDSGVPGALVGAETVGVVQLRRAARETKLADLLVAFPALAAARDFFDEFIAELRRSGASA